MKVSSNLKVLLLTRDLNIDQMIENKKSSARLDSTLNKTMYENLKCPKKAPFLKNIDFNQNCYKLLTFNHFILYLAIPCCIVSF
jgi:hypothetical protein